MQWFRFSIIILALFAVSGVFGEATKTITRTKYTTTKISTSIRTASKTTTKTITRVKTTSALPRTITKTRLSTQTKLSIVSQITTRTLTQSGKTLTITTKLPGATSTIVSTFLSTNTKSTTIYSTKLDTTTIVSTDLSTTTVSSTSTISRTATVTSIQTVNKCLPTYVNVIPNSDFEYGLNGWSPSAAPVGASISTRCDTPVPGDWVFQGKCALAALFTTPTNQPIILPQYITLCRRTQYHLKFVFKITGTCTFQYLLDNSDGGTIGNTGSPATWYVFEGPLGVADSREQATDLELKFVMRSGSGGNCGVSLDGLSIEAVGTLAAKRDERGSERHSGFLSLPPMVITPTSVM